MLSADDYYPALRRDDVHLETAGIARVLPDGVELIDGRFVPLDVLVYATGFRSTEFLVPMTVKSRGRELSEEWREGPAPTSDSASPASPNFFVMYGPNTNLGHNSIVFMLEAQARHIVRVLADMAHGDEVEVSRDAFDRQDRALRRDLARTVWGQVERSWYKTDAGRITNNWGPEPAVLVVDPARRPLRLPAAPSHDGADHLVLAPGHRVAPFAVDLVRRGYQRCAGPRRPPRCGPPCPASAARPKHGVVLLLVPDLAVDLRHAVVVLEHVVGDRPGVGVLRVGVDVHLDHAVVQSLADLGQQRARAAMEHQIERLVLAVLVTDRLLDVVQNARVSTTLPGL